MKPRLKKIYGVWHCRSEQLLNVYWDASFMTRVVTGVGYTKRQAYDDWKAQA